MPVMLSIRHLRPGSDEWIQQAVIISLFTDARALPDDELSDDDKRGYWADVFLDNDASLGSRLWTQTRQKLSEEVIAKIRDIAQTALQWLIDERWLDAIGIDTDPDRDNDRLNLTLTLTRRDRRTVLTYAL